MVRLTGVCVLLVLLVTLLGCGGTNHERDCRECEETAGDGAATILTVRPAGDTWLNAASALTNYGADARLHAGNYPRAARRTLMQFSLAKIPTTATVNKAYLYVYILAVNQGTDRYRVHRATKSWTEATANWANNAAFYSATISAVRTIDPSMVSTLVRFDVTTLAQSWVQAPTRNFGCLIRGSEGSAKIGIVMGSRENPLAGARPRLVVDYTP
jgi:hypothetical protein